MCHMKNRAVFPALGIVNILCRYNKRLAARMKGHCGRAVVQPQIGCNCLFQLSRLNRLEQVLDRADAVAVLEKFRRACDKQDAGFVVALPQFLRQTATLYNALTILLLVKSIVANILLFCNRRCKCTIYSG